MAFDENLDKRIRQILNRWEISEAKKMFGGMCYLNQGNMVCGIYKEYLILRLKPETAAELLQKEHFRPFDITGRPMKGWVMVAPEAISDDGDLEKYLQLCRDFVSTLPPK